MPGRIPSALQGASPLQHPERSWESSAQRPPSPRLLPPVPGGTCSRGRAGTSCPCSAVRAALGKTVPRWLPELLCLWPQTRTRARGGQRSLILTLKAWEHLDEALA